MITLATYGVGMLIGFWIAGIIANNYATEGGGHLWKNIWLIPAAIAFAVFILFALLFKDKKHASSPNETVVEKQLGGVNIT
jgi:MFS family permease